MELARPGVVVGFVDDRAGGDHIGYRGLPLLGTLSEVVEIAQREKIDHLYVALPLEAHAKLLDLMTVTSREFIDVKVVPDLLQFLTLQDGQAVEVHDWSIAEGFGRTNNRRR